MTAVSAHATAIAPAEPAITPESTTSAIEPSTATATAGVPGSTARIAQPRLSATTATNHRNRGERAECDQRKSDGDFEEQASGYVPALARGRKRNAQDDGACTPRRRAGPEGEAARGQHNATAPVGFSAL